MRYDSEDAGHRFRFGAVDAEDAGVGMGRSQDVAMDQAGRLDELLRS